MAGIIKPNGMKFVSNNTGKSKRASIILAELLKKREIDVCLLQEPYSYEGEIRYFDTFQKMFSESQIPKCAIILNQDIAALKCLKDPCAVTAKIVTGGIEIAVASIYLQ